MLVKLTLLRSSIMEFDFLLLFLQRKAISGPGFAIFFFVSAIMMAHQTYQGFREGYAYNGVISRVYKKNAPTKFKIWLSFQISFVVLLTFFALNAIFIWFE